MQVHKKLNEARLKLQSTKLNKTGHNKFANYTYFELGDFLPTINTIFGELGLCGVVSYGTDLATLTITAIDDDSSIVITSPMAEANLKGCHPIQNLGAVETYTRRYLWVTAMEIVEHDALDATTGKNESTLVGNIKSHKTPLAGALDNVTPERLEVLKETAATIVDFAAKEQWDDAFITYDNISENDERVAVWALLQPNSAVRSKLKAIGENKRKAA